MWCSFYLRGEKVEIETAFLVIPAGKNILKPFSSGFSIISEQKSMMQCLFLELGVWALLYGQC